MPIEDFCLRRLFDFSSHGLALIDCIRKATLPKGGASKLDFQVTTLTIYATTGHFESYFQNVFVKIAKCIFQIAKCIFLIA